MEQKQRFFIYDRREMGVLVLLGILVALFSFTLGVHLGKRVIPIGGSGAVSDESSSVSTTQDKVPGRQDLTEQAKGPGQASDESLSQSLHDEVTRAGIKLDHPLQVELPSEAKTKNAGGTTTAATNEKASDDPESKEYSGEMPKGKFTLQIGSFPSDGEAKHLSSTLSELGLKPFTRVAEIHGKGKWHRVFLGGYPSKEEAEKAGDRLKGKHVVDSFIVSKMPN